MKKRLQTIISHAGVASRRNAAEFINDGKVKVDGMVVLEKGLRLDPLEHRILVDGRALPVEENKRYFLLNKPGGIISTAKDTHGRKKVTDFFGDIGARLYPVGRLDKDTTGLMIVTNDGDLAHRLSHPSFGVDKEYLVTLDGGIDLETIDLLEQGIEIDERMTAPCDITPVRETKRGTVLRVRIHEGRKRQIRMMFKLSGCKVIELARIGYAGLALGKLKQGEYRELTPKEVKRLKAMVRDS